MVAVESESQVTADATGPAVSVVIPAYNAAQFIRGAIDSVLAQSFTDYEIIVVDDGSSDSTADVVRGYGDRVRLLSQPNSGASSARNRGVGESRGRLVAFLDADDVWLPRKLEKQVRLFRARPDLGLVATSHEIHFADRVVQFDKRRALFSDENVAKSIVINSGLLTSSIAVRRQILIDLGGFDETLHIGEDDDLWIRITARHPSDMVDDVLVKHRVRPGSLSTDQERLFSDVLKSLDSLMAGDPVVREKIAGAVTLKRAIILCDRGYFYWDHGRVREARQAFRQSLRHDHRYRRAWKYLLLSYLPSPVMTFLREMKRRMRRS